MNLDLRHNDGADMDTCECRKALNHSFKTVEDSVLDTEVIVANSELLAISDRKDLRLFRCKVCGTVWVEACYSSGQMMIEYLYPAPQTTDPIRWLNEEGYELPPKQWEEFSRVWRR